MLNFKKEKIKDNNVRSYKNIKVFVSRIEIIYDTTEFNRIYSYICFCDNIVNSASFLFKF